MPRLLLQNLRLQNITSGLIAAVTLLDELNNAFEPPFIQPISKTVLLLIDVTQVRTCDDMLSSVSRPHHAHRPEDTMPPRRSTAHPTDAYTAKPLAILRHTPLVHRVLPCTRYYERYHKPRHSLPAHAWVTSKTSTRTPTAGAGRKDGSRSNAESERRGISYVNVSSPTSSSEQRVGCLMYREGEWLGRASSLGYYETDTRRKRRQCGMAHRAQNLGEATTATMCSPTSGTGRAIGYR
ncbi:hypothetical protein B0H14DRAFT_3003749 [Mycena olivaceomarginata]|nr:hypothetical protein B0H14DRAFT_3003749 [Mycena olivaceomarginata]